MFGRIVTIETSRKGWIVVVILFCCLVILLTGVDRKEEGDANTNNNLVIVDGDTAWMLTSCAFVMLMSLPGLALFYAGYSDERNQINTMAMIFSCYALVSVIWIWWGYALAFGEDRGGIIGNGRHIFLQGMNPSSINPLAPTIPEYVYVMYQLTFAAITVGLTAGGLTERMKFWSWMIYVVFWLTIVYLPIAHWVWGGGFLAQWGVIDFAGGTVVHITSGISALVASLVIGKPRNEKEHPRSLTFILVGAGMIWFGWFGFNGGSALAANASAGIAFLNTNIAASVACIGWILLQTFHTGKPTLGGLCDAAIAGLVGITPAAGFVNPMGAFIIGVLSIGTYGAVLIKVKTRYVYDPSNAFGVHCIGGIIGSIATGIYADPGIGLKAGFLFSNYKQLGWQIVGVLIPLIYAAIMTAVILFIMKYTIGIRVSAEYEEIGQNQTQHGEVCVADEEGVSLVLNRQSSQKHSKTQNVGSKTYLQQNTDNIPIQPTDPYSKPVRTTEFDK